MNTFLTTLSRYMALVSAGIIALMPFHAFLTVWAASFMGHYTWLRLWKEVVLLILFVGFAVLFFRYSTVRKKCWQEPLIGLISVYIIFALLSGLIAYVADKVTLQAFAYGLLSDTRYLVFFGVTWLCSQYSDVLIRVWKKLLLIPAMITVGFATLQYAVLAADFLKHFGYGPDTISPSATIDQKDAYTRIQSTMRGPNPFGAYLMIIMSTLAALVARMKKVRVNLVAFYILSGLALVFTFSRSAWLGTLASTLWLLWIHIRSKTARQVLLLGGSVAVLVFAGVGYALRENDHFQNVFFHTNENSMSAESSNSGHISAVQEGIADIVREPLGGGTGTAGPASVYNDGPPRIAENYYIQIGQETGAIGLGLFIAINVYVILRLLRQKQLLATVLLASFIGITIINLLMHAWADDTLAYIWWGLAGAAGAPRADREHEHTI